MKFARINNLPLDQFINLALYNKNTGYYMKKNPFGKEGDFITAPNITRLFSEIIAIWTITFWKSIGSPNKFNLLELGAGNGEMMKVIDETLKNFPECYSACNFILHEKSNFLIKEQKKNLNSKKFSWLKNIEKIDRNPTIFLANEFFDAIPIKQLFKKENGWIERLVNLNNPKKAEFKEESKRMEKLDEQFDDLNRALETLTGAIKQIDDESKSRFSETFEKVNAGLSKHFPRLFDGGKAYLELEDDDALNGGVFVMARPPGKRNSNIHLLSGGEKALTAVALLFSIFELNPAPFCLLDEVDAPLDDTNVSRFCEIVKEMSSSVQFVVITHNKTTMELTKQLIGVTMSEPGVSRLVSVDLDEAVELADQAEAT